MKNIVLKIFAVLVLVACVLLPCFSLTVEGNNKNVTSTISEELGTLSEITSEAETTQTPILLYMSFEEKLSHACSYSDKELTTAPEITEPEVTVIEEKTEIQETRHEPLITETYIKETIAEYETESPVVEEINEVDEIVDYEDYSGEYASATTIWNYLRNLGYNKAVSAGILGNIMSECGGHTLYIQWWLYDGGYYGICQWYIGYYPEVNGAGLMEQLNHLANTIAYEINTFGYKYYNGFDYEAFLAIDNSYDAAIAFAKCYERCASWTYSSRTSNAYKAYNYFA